jgi:hypothetical protein
MRQFLRNLKNRLLVLAGGKPAFKNDAELFETVGELISELRLVGCESVAAIVQAGFYSLNGLTDGWAVFLEYLERAAADLPKEAGPDIKKKLRRVLAAARYAVYRQRS